MSGAKRTAPGDRARIQKLVFEERRTKAEAGRIVGFSRKTVIKVCQGPREHVTRRPPIA